MKLKYRKLKDATLLVFLDAVAVTAASFLSLLMTQSSFNLKLDFVYWLLINYAATFFFFGLFRLYSIVFTSVGLNDTLKTVGAVISIYCINVVCIFFPTGQIKVASVDAV